MLTYLEKRLAKELIIGHRLSIKLSKTEKDNEKLKTLKSFSRLTYPLAGLIDSDENMRTFAIMIYNPQISEDIIIDFIDKHHDTKIFESLESAPF
jgi:hypothetical protein